MTGRYGWTKSVLHASGLVVRPAPKRSAHRADRGETVRNFVWERAADHDQATARVKRSPNRTANWALAMAHSRDGIFQAFSARFKTRNSSLVAASSVGKWPRVRTARRSLAFKASMACVV